MHLLCVSVFLFNKNCVVHACEYVYFPIDIIKILFNVFVNILRNKIANVALNNSKEMITHTVQNLLIQNLK